jgi:23S rRNA G2445 N2-methylase RlmL
MARDFSDDSPDRPPPSQYYATTVAGLETVASREVLAGLPGAVIGHVQSGHLHFTYPGPVRDLLGLRTVEDVFAHIADLQGVGPEATDLEALKDAVAQVDLEAALALRAKLSPLPAAPSFRVTGSRVGEHRYNSQQAAGFAGAGIIAQRGWKVDLTGHDLEIALHIEHDRALLGLRLSDDTLARRSRVVHGIASLQPTVAHAMCLLSDPQPGEVLLDPMCGTGTIVVERLSLPQAVTAIGADRDPRVLRLARENLRAAAAPVRLYAGDGRQAPLPEGGVDKIVCNLPWGNRVGSHRANRRLYPAFIAEALRLLRPGGRMVVLTMEKRLTQGLLDGSEELVVEETHQANAGGLVPTIYVVGRR